MIDIKLAKLPNRVPKKVTFSATPDLAELLNSYAAIYEKSYGQKETVEELIPFMLLSFLQGDRRFAKARKKNAKINNAISTAARAAAQQ